MPEHAPDVGVLAHRAADERDAPVERGGGVAPPGATCSPGVDNPIGNGGIHAYRVGALQQSTPGTPDEAFASYAEEAAGAQGFAWCRRPGRSARLVTRGVDFFRGRRASRYGAIYFEGACLLDMLRKRIGRARFERALREYALANRYGWSTAAEFRAAMDAVSPVPLADLWRRYRVQ